MRVRKNKRDKGKLNVNINECMYHKLLLSPATSPYMNPLRDSALISSTKNDQQGVVQDASQ